jgi:tripartite-type tricarboxylate transporter receptor subunit TctC
MVRVAVARIEPAPTITMIVPFPAGGTTDTLAAVMADR